MTLPKPHPGESMGFHIYGNYVAESTTGQREQLIWSSIKHLCSSEIASETLNKTYQIADATKRTAIASNIKLYINQAFDFYSSASQASANTSPLFYYYSFMNLAKAICEIKNPNFHKTQESYHHGLSWHPNSNFTVNMLTEHVKISTKGVWHALYESISNKPLAIPNPTNLLIKDLFSCCPETSSEYEECFGALPKLIELCYPQLLCNTAGNQVWIRFSIIPHLLKHRGISIKKFNEIVSNGGAIYRQVLNEDDEHLYLYTFELATPKKVNPSNEILFSLLKPEIQMMNIFVHPELKSLSPEFVGLCYYVTVQDHLPLMLPQLMLLYTISFWLGSLVRYDPSSVSYLQDSKYWRIIEGFISQSRLLLLELFEWEFYQCETTLISA